MKPPGTARPPPLTGMLTTAGGRGGGMRLSSCISQPVFRDADVCYLGRRDGRHRRRLPAVPPEGLALVEEAE